MKTKTIFEVRLLQSTAYNSRGEFLKIKLEDNEGNLYYYDSMRRWCFLEKEEEGVVWERISKK